ncbi:hypothetical protein PILCRDRAFT_813204 [Piloderma croceum F 1598]|uniref:Helicase ATP-binding domain-containing protein n=1 Tax=Piloderma croceum (strain F 1598) TaxID=765440 RepID=A0A0C3CHK3_PILCF|nr:hypothetical protein PILCRDRAFT_813204 [Piloderma croceum F 1598]
MDSDVNIVTLTGTKEECTEIIANRLILQDLEVSDEICLIEKSAFKKYSFEYIVIDEAHRIKNVDSSLSQNSLKELFALLNFICPEIFVDYADLDSFLHKDETGVEDQESRRGIA